MREHRLIERMVRMLHQQAQRMSEKNSLDIAFLEVAVDFFRTYADKTHHGKEEDILFRELAGKELSPKDRAVMNGLIQEHAFARNMVARLLDAQKGYSAGRSESIGDVFHCIQELTSLYPRHIATEDKDFFYPCLEYLSQEEQTSMLEKFQEYDSGLIHDKYQKIVEEAGTKYG